jgi:fructose-1,6-bisphosphatase I
MRIPKKRGIYSVNEGNAMYWDAPTTEYFESVKFPKSGKPYSARYIGSMVADVHRTLLYGGIFSYPSDSKSPHGKLRLLYECFPMAKLVEEAGGLAFDGTGRVLEQVPKQIHERGPVWLGSYDEVSKVVEIFERHAKK